MISFIDYVSPEVRGDIENDLFKNYLIQERQDTVYYYLRQRGVYSYQIYYKLFDIESKKEDHCKRDKNDLCLIDIVIGKIDAKNKNETKDFSLFSLNENLSLYFEIAEYNLSKDKYHVLNRYVAWLKENPKDTLLIEGYTDRQGSEKLNNLLSKLRAFNIYRYFFDRGVLFEQLEKKSYGELKSLGAYAKRDDGKEYHAEDRRVDLTLRKDKTQITGKKLHEEKSAITQASSLSGKDPLVYYGFGLSYSYLSGSFNSYLGNSFGINGFLNGNIKSFEMNNYNLHLGYLARFDASYSLTKEFNGSNNNLIKGSIFLATLSSMSLSSSRLSLVFPIGLIFDASNIRRGSESTLFFHGGASFGLGFDYSFDALTFRYLLLLQRPGFASKLDSVESSISFAYPLY